MAEESREKKQLPERKAPEKGALVKRLARRASRKPAAKEQPAPRPPAGSREKKSPGQKARAGQPALRMEAGTIRYVHMTEKAVRAIEPHNQLVFVVRRGAGKASVRKAVEAAFGERVSEVRTLVDQKGRKKAFVRFAKEGAAGELAIKLGII